MNENNEMNEKMRVMRIMSNMLKANSCRKGQAIRQVAESQFLAGDILTGTVVRKALLVAYIHQDLAKVESYA